MLTSGVLPKNFFLKLSMKIILVIAAGEVITTALLYFSNQVWLGNSYFEVLRTLSEAKRLLFRNSVTIYLLTAFFTIGGIVLLTLFYSHRVAGALYRLAVLAKRIAEGDLTVHVKLRKKDAIHPLADSMNCFVEGYNGRIREIFNQIISLKESALEMDKAGGRKEQEGLQRTIDEVSEKIERLEQSILSVKL